MIARTWRGATRAADGETYARYVRDTGLTGYRMTPGNRGACLLYRLQDDKALFLTLSLWGSLDDIHAFAGDEISQAVFYPEDDRYLIERDIRADHWQVAEPFDEAALEPAGTVARTWRGTTRGADAGSYAEYLRGTGLSEYRATRGNRAAYLLYRIEDDQAHFLAISLWDSLEDVRGFAGSDLSKAVFYPEADVYLVARDDHADHWRLELPA